MAERIKIGHLPIDAVDMAGAVSAIDALVSGGQGGMVFTPNVDHVVVAESNRRFRAAYGRASLSLVDGVPVLWAARLLGCPMPEKVSGSDLIEPLIEKATARGWRVFLLGAAPGIAEKAADVLRAKYPTLKIVGTDAPHISLDGDPEKRLAVARAVASAAPDLILVAFGAPKQEIFCDETFAVLKPAVMVCVGAGLDFIAGSAKRAPLWVSRVGLEWLYRLAREPRRLSRRYLLRDPKFVLILIRHLRSRLSLVA